MLLFIYLFMGNKIGRDMKVPFAEAHLISFLISIDYYNNFHIQRACIRMTVYNMFNIAQYVS